MLAPLCLPLRCLLAPQLVQLGHLALELLQLQIQLQLQTLPFSPPLLSLLPSTLSFARSLQLLLALADYALHQLCCLLLARHNGRLQSIYLLLQRSHLSLLALQRPAQLCPVQLTLAQLRVHHEILGLEDSKLVLPCPVLQFQSLALGLDLVGGCSCL